MGTGESVHGGEEDLAEYVGQESGSSSVGAMGGTVIFATAVGAIIGVASTLVVDCIRWHRERSERNRTELRVAFTQYLTALTSARDAFSRIELSPERVGRGHISVGEYGVYGAQQQLELVASQAVVDLAGRATLALLDFHDAVAAGNAPETTEYLQAWRAVRETRRALLDSMRTRLRT
ncbi:hypothetical protein V2S66_28905 [Streptomyces sp. V4-01]|uniref:Uncharacterized protein n=1 Tax=Actinacidiphila polyblastidii TaxID=3110430 RepID=A0ABU7PJH9_9ACTN|nr:hypothetical protein [Streptomyces sp. V4-01]